MTPKPSSVFEIAIGFGPGVPQPPTRTVPRRAHKPRKVYDAEQVHRVIIKYNEFVGSLRNAEERQKAARKIRRFQTSHRGSAFIKELVTRHYWKVMDLLKLDKRISVYDDGLVEFMFLFEGAMEVAPSQVFITYAWLTYREHRGRVPTWLGEDDQPLHNIRCSL